MHNFRWRILTAVFLFSCLGAAAAPPHIGEKAPDFTLSATDGTQVRLSEVTGQAPVVLVVLRGFPGYQCPFCQRQVQDFVARAQDFSNAGAKVVFVYPGPRDKLSEHAAEFLAGKNFPPSFLMLLDPDYQFTNLYGLRWNAPRETAYPSTFILDQEGIVIFSRVVKSHGARTSTAEVLDILPKKK
jgi:peroxiredoxin